MRVILVTGGAGFIGSTFIKYFLRRNKDFIIVNLDKLTYAASLENLRELENSPRHHFVKGDICNQDLVNYIMKRFRPDYVINFAAETNVDRSISNPAVFVQSNVMGTLTLLEAARYQWSKSDIHNNRFIQVSTDEVYGSLRNDEDFFMEESNLVPNSPYSASKAGADMLVQSFVKTHGMPAVITRSCNNYGPCQNLEKFIPKCIINALEDKPIPIYGDAMSKREWINVIDHCIGIIRVMFYGKPGEIYNIGSGEELSNFDIAKRILNIMGKPENAIEMIDERPGNDRRCALNSYKIRNNLSWSSKYSLDEGLKETVKWYKENKEWWKR